MLLLFELHYLFFSRRIRVQVENTSVGIQEHIMIVYTILKLNMYRIVIHKHLQEKKCYHVVYNIIVCKFSICPPHIKLSQIHHFNTLMIFEYYIILYLHI